MQSVGEAATDGLIHTVDYVSAQGPMWIVTAGLILSGGMVVFFLKLILQQAKEGRKELKELNDKYISGLEKNAAAQADNASEVRSFGRQVAGALENSSFVIKGNTEAINDNTTATRLQVKASDATTTALIDLKNITDKTATEVRKQGDDTDAAIRRNTDALEGERKAVRKQP